ncbi:MAG: EF-P lysine aminoacylase EpmA [Gammaproteobacteria bacterium]|nr:EF-P lysine aminoacylase EpmA [Gammaproteobacteria bacterium]
MTEPGWGPTGSLEALRARAAALGAARDFMARRGVLEVETPALVAHSTTDPGIESLPVANGSDTQWLRTSPEFHMKRLLAAGAPDIYQLGKAFRAAESGRLHEPEFTLLEWYRLGFTAKRMATETVELIQTVAEVLGSPWPQAPALTYREAFTGTVNLDPVTASMAELLDCCATQPGWHAGLEAAMAADRDALLDFIASHGVWPALPRDTLVVVQEFPLAQALLARPSAADPDAAERFEVFLNGIELGNGYHELQDAAEHRRRFAADNALRRRRAQPEMTPDAQLLAALDAGLPDCAGVAVGIDRIILCALQEEELSGVISFSSGS